MTDHKDSFPVQRLDVVNTGRRRRWTLAEKLRIVDESYQGYHQISATARRYELSPSLLYSWRKKFAGGGPGRTGVIGFSPALIVPEQAAAVSEEPALGRMEILTGTGQRILVGADVDARALARVVAALEGR